MRWKLKGLDRVMEPSDFSLEVKGALYPDRRGKQTRLRGQLEMNISFVLPPVLELVPEDVRRNLANAVRNCYIKLYLSIFELNLDVSGIVHDLCFSFEPFTGFDRFSGEYEA